MSNFGTLTERFLARLPEPLHEPGLAGEELESLLARVVDQARGAWPKLPYATETFISELAERMPVDVELVDHLETLPAADVYLAYACAHSIVEAVRAFELHLIPVVERALARLGAQPDAIDEVKQRLRERLLVGTGGRPPAAGTYAGYGSLAAWVRVSAVREYYGLAHEGQRWQNLEESQLAGHLDGAAPGSGTGPEMAFLKEQYRPQFRAALSEAMTCLEARQRNVLRHHYLDGLQVDQIGALYRVHRVTASRWLAAARKAVLSHTRRLLSAELDISPEEFESIVRLIHSQLDLSIRTQLRLADDSAG